ncbi:DoxX family membrane protein [Nocardia sp. NPDC051030]|uniref:DoxX family membrane protein n=1 Tax=Nocardia sp. NPDC051030 TaxID=3155162 RepID=UPI0034197803
MFRRVAYPLLASAFIADGIETLRNPETRVKSATTLVQRGERALPDSVTAKLPTDPERVVRITAAVRIGGGVLLGLGRAPRLASMVLATTTIPVALTEHDFWNEPDKERRIAQRTAFLWDASLLGGLLIAASDTRGKPSLGWRARRAADRASRKLHDEGKGTVAQLADNVAAQAPAVWEAVRDRGEHLAGSAREHGGHLAEVARDKGEQVAEVARDRGEQLAEVARDRGEQFAEVARGKGGQLAETARDKGGQLVETALDTGGQLAEVARDKGGQLVETARQRGELAAEAALERRTLARKRGARARRRAARLADKAADRAQDRRDRLAEAARKGGERVADTTRDLAARIEQA